MGDSGIQRETMGDRGIHWEIEGTDGDRRR